MTSLPPGRIHLYTGPGKGKTTAAVGLAARAAGAGLAVRFVQFMKERDSGEIAALARLGVPVLRGDEGGGLFTFSMTPEQRRAYAASQRRLWRKAVAGPDDVDLLVLDEVVVAARLGLLDAGEIAAWLQARPPRLEVALTGRGPVPELEALADYHSDIAEIRHPFRRGEAARRGIEF